MPPWGERPAYAGVFTVTALTSEVTTCYMLGVSTRRMDRWVQSLGIAGLSKSHVSVMAKDLDAWSGSSGSAAGSNWSRVKPVFGARPTGGTCESGRCTGMPPEMTRRGGPILDVDDIQDLALDAADHPRNMIALCPNGHACKTRGAHTARWRRELTLVAAAAHEAGFTPTTD